MRSAVILDLDGTLADSLPDISAALNRSLERLSLPPVAPEKCRLMVGSGAWNLCGRAVGGRRDMQQPLYDLYRRDYSQNLAVLTRPYPGIADMLSAMRGAGLRTAVISNKDQGDTERVLAHCFPAFSFDLVLGRRGDGVIKPDPAPGLLCLSLLGASAEEAVVVGDSNVDVAFAAALSCPSVGCAWGFRGEKELVGSGCTRLCRAPCEVLPCILSL